MLADVTNVTADALGLGMQCARCHDHKFDPILQKDYRIQAFFAPLLPRVLAVGTLAERTAFSKRTNGGAAPKHCGSNCTPWLRCCSSTPRGFEKFIDKIKVMIVNARGSYGV